MRSSQDLSRPVADSTQRRRRVRCPAAWLVVLVAVVLGGWLGVLGWQARGALLDVRADLEAAAVGSGAGSTIDLELAVSRASADVARARSAVDDPVWRVASAIPVAGRSFAAVRGSTLVAGRVVDGVLPPTVRAAQRLDGALLAGGTVDLAVLDALAGDVDEASAAADGAEAVVARVPGRLVPGMVGRPVDELRDGVRRLAAALSAARAAVAVAPGMLGAAEPRRYFLAVHNNAEARGTGGLVGAYVVLVADGGRLSTEAVGTNDDFRAAAAPVVDLGPAFSDLYDKDEARTYWASAVRTPDWPAAASILAGLWRAQSGAQVDAVVGLDPRAMAELLAVTGPAELGGRSIGAGDVVDFVLRDEYVEFEGDEAGRSAALTELARALYGEFAGGDYSGSAMLAALGRAGGSGHLQVWSSRPQEQAVFAPLRAGGALPGVPGAYLQVVSNNDAGNKADYYVRRRVTYERTGRDRALVTVELRNEVVAADVPPIVVGRLDPPAGPVEPGQTRVLLAAFVGVGDAVQRVLVDGVESAADLGSERGHGVGSVPVEVRPSRPTVVVFEVTDQGGPLVYRQQPLVVDDDLDLRVPHRIE